MMPSTNKAAAIAKKKASIALKKSEVTLKNAAVEYIALRLDPHTEYEKKQIDGGLNQFELLTLARMIVEIERHRANEKNAKSNTGHSWKKK